MNERPTSLSDAAIREALERRAPGHADSAFLRQIIAAADMLPQVARPRLRWGVLWGDVSRLRVAMVAAGLVAVVLTAAGLIGGGLNWTLGPTPAPTPVASPRASQSGQEESPLTGACASSPATILTGAAMPAPITQPGSIAAGSVSAGVWVTGRYVPGQPGDFREIWVVGSDGTAHRLGTVASVDGDLQVEDVSSDGSSAIISVNRDPGNQPTCIDLFEVPTDGSALRRIASDSFACCDGLNMPGGLRLSSDGSLLAYPGSSIAGADHIPLMIEDLRSSTRSEVACGDPLFPTWARSEVRLAVICGSDLVVVAADGSSRSFLLPTADAIIAVGWGANGEVLIASTPPLNAPAEVTLWSIVPTTAAAGTDAFRAVAHSTPELTLAMGFAAYLSPSGHELLMRASQSGNHVLPWMVIDPFTGSAVRLSDTDEGRDVSHASDWNSVVFVEGNDEQTMLRVRRLDERTTTVLGRLPATYNSGRWLVP